MKKTLRKKIFLSFLLLPLLTSCTNKLDYQNNIKESNLKETTVYLTTTIGNRPTGSENDKLAFEYSYDHLNKLKYPKIYTQEFDTTLGKSKNVIISNKKDTNKDRKIINVLAHYDTFDGCPGATDNSAGIASLFEIARVLKKYKSNHEIRFIALGAEEIGYIGSKYYVNNLSEEEKENTIASFVIDIPTGSIGEDLILVANTLGGRTKDGYVEGKSSKPIDNVVSKSIRDAYIELGYVTLEQTEEYWMPRTFGLSDHVSFHNVEIDAANIGWRGRKIDGNLPKNYHQPEDVEETLDYDRLMITTKVITKAIINLDQNIDKYIAY